MGLGKDYNPFNTAVYAGLFALAAAYLGFPALKKLGIQLDREFFIGIVPYAFLGGALRSLEDIGAAPAPLFVTPFIYFVIFGLIISMIWLSKKAAELVEPDYHQILGGAGALLLVFVLSFHSLNNVNALAFFSGVTLAWMLGGYFALKFLRPELLSYTFSLPVAAHFFDASTTVTALEFGGQEKHVLANFFIQLFGPYGMFLMKGLIVVPAVYYIDRNVEGEEKMYYLFLIAVLGIGIATRNLLTLLTVS